MLLLLYLSCVGESLTLSPVHHHQRWQQQRYSPSTKRLLAPLAANTGIQVGSDRFSLVYTCGKCNTRNVIKVSRKAWNSGVVIGKCFGCDAKHLLADNTGLTDTTNGTKFSDAFNDALRRGVPAKRLDTSDKEALRAEGIELLEDGNFSLVAREGETTRTENGRVVATSSSPMNATIAQEEEVEDVVIVDGEKEVELVAEDAPVVRLPQGIQAGAVLKIQTPAGDMIHLGVPEGAYEGCFLIVEGLVQLQVPEDAEDVMSVPLPDGTVVPVVLDDTDEPGSLVSIGFPVTISPPPQS